ncbi:MULTISPECIES: DUF4238 domain-containing protein [unclassified Acinetobacter]|uniref:DUF4238 domain-containing protein n=1 Tax=unclassified Acinetobacter TaxID=196816 RepID=UPI0018EBA00E|nr:MULTISPECIES: DUF4238 domain-containing protein [unclassified Acinetobacter]MBJ6354333.1 DUF4238 domain-containing protein [Acinetobacter sp. c1]MBM0959951.1 DUF4238 domain-containing protein [Acinetobacter sp. C13]
MGRKSKHHYIPKCYLKEFTKDRKTTSLFWCIPNNNTKSFQTSPNDSCAQRDYYTIGHIDPLIIEDFYANQVEPKISLAINYINKYASIPQRNERQNLVLLMAALYLRVPFFRQLVQKPLEQMKEVITSMEKDVSISNKDEFNFNQTDLIRIETKLLSRIQNYLTTKYFQLFVINEPDLYIIISDNPFVLTHPLEDEQNFSFGLNTPNIEILIPITKKAFIIAKNEPCNEISFIADKKLVALVNTKLLLNSHKYIYSCDDKILLLDSELKVYEHHIQSG